MYRKDLGPILRACNLSAVGENVAYGYPSGSAVMGGWMDRAELSRCPERRPRLLGVARSSSDGRWYAAQVFGA